MDLKYWNKEIQKINRGLYLEPVNYDGVKFWCIKHKDDRTGLIRNVFTVMDRDGNPAELDMSVLRRLALEIDWEAVYKNPNPEKLADEWLKKYQEYKTKKNLEEKGFMLDFVNDNKPLVRGLMKNFHKNFTPTQLKKMEKEKLENWKNRKIKIYK